MESVGDVLANVLRTQSRLENTGEKLQELRTEEAKKYLSAILFRGSHVVKVV